MKAFDIGLSALRTHQQSLATMGHNIANASTPGYHRQRVELINRPPAVSDLLHVGRGVDVDRITRLRNAAIETALLRNSSVGGYADQSLLIASQIEHLLAPGETSVHASLSSVFNRLEQTTNAAQDMTVRREFLTSAQELVRTFHQLDDSLRELDTEVRRSLADSVLRINQLVRDAAELNSQIFQARGLRREPNDLLDQRDRLMTEISTLMEVEIGMAADGSEHIILAGGAAVIGHRSVHLELAEHPSGHLGIRRAGGTSFFPIAAGSLRGLLEAANQIIPDQQQRLQQLAGQLVRSFDQQHAQGLPDSGAFTRLAGQRAVTDITLPLGQTTTPFPVSSGRLYVTVTDLATGIRRTEQITINAEMDSLQSVATMLGGLTGIAATVDPARATLSIHADDGYTVDFAGRPDNVPDLTSVAGTTQPRVTGLYAGDNNDEWTVTFSGPGIIGQTPGLTAVIMNSAGQQVASHQVGEGYEGGKPLQILDGVSLTLESGTVAAGDQFSLHLVATSDETGLLSALGINSLFEGGSTGTFKVRAELWQNPQQLSGSQTGITGDAANFARMAAIRDERFAVIGGRTLTEEMAELTADAGLSVQSSENHSRQIQFLQQRLQADRDAVSGVDINEEMLRMMEVERAWQAATRFISTVNSTLDELFRLVQ